MLLLYNFFSAIALLLYFPWLLFKKGPESKLTFLSERLGRARYTDTDIWVHAVSVGETIACLPFLKKLMEEFPEKKILFSTTTYTGQKIAREKFPEADRIMYMPWDTGLCVNKAVKLLKPKVFITIETELWPVLFKTLKDNGSYIVILNGRISQKSFKGYKRLRPFMKDVLLYVDFLYMQGEGDAERIIAIGAEPKKVGVMGNFKFDIELDESKSLHWTDEIKGEILLAGSTHKGEEEIILDAYEKITKTRDKDLDLRLILAPRHPERFGEVEELLKKRGLNYVRRSELSVHGSRFTVHGKQPDIILLDTIGELSYLYSKVDIAFIGGSLVPHGGQNLIEAAYWEKPILFGPHMESFPIAEEFLEEAAALQVKDADDIAKTVNELLEDNEKAELIGQRAKEIVDRNTGAVKKALELVRGYIGTI